MRHIWTTKFRMFSSGGKPKWFWFPRIHRAAYNSYWGMSGFYVVWLGKQVMFSFGTDVRGFYETLGKRRPE